MGMSRPAVESTLFRARRRLTEEYDDIVSGARCERIQGIIVAATQSALGLRDTRRLARHLSHCQGCRREALAAGLDRELLTRPSVRERIASRVAGLLPFPAFVKFRGRGAAAASDPARTQWASQLPMFSDHLSSGWGKAAAGAASCSPGSAPAPASTRSRRRPRRATGPPRSGRRPSQRSRSADQQARAARSPTAPEAAAGRRRRRHDGDKGSTRGAQARQARAQRERAKRGERGPERAGRPRPAPRPAAVSRPTRPTRRTRTRLPKSEEPKKESSAADRKPSSEEAEAEAAAPRRRPPSRP